MCNTAEDAPKYSDHVIEKLVGIKGDNKDEVINYMVTSWIGEHVKELEHYGIGIKRKNNA